MCHYVWLVCPCRALEGTFPYCVCFSGLQFPSPFALTIKSHFIQLCLIYLVNLSTYKPGFLSLWLLVYCFLLCISVLPWFGLRCLFFNFLINASLASSCFGVCHDRINQPSTDPAAGRGISDFEPWAFESFLRLRKSSGRLGSKCWQLLVNMGWE